MKLKIPNFLRLSAQRRKTAIPMVLGLLVTMFFYFTYVLKPTPLQNMQNLTFDAYQRILPRQYDPQQPVRIVDIDDESLRRIGQWPWPRTTIAKLNNRLTEAGAAVIAYDVIFSEPDRTSPENMLEVLRNNPDAVGNFDNVAGLQSHDKVFADAIANSRVVLGFFLINKEKSRDITYRHGFAWSGATPKRKIEQNNGLIAPLVILEKNALGEGFVSFNPKGDGIVRRAPLLARINDRYYPALSIEALRVAQGAGAFVVRSSNGSGTLEAIDPEKAEVVDVKIGAFTAPTTPDGQLLVYFTKPYTDATQNDEQQIDPRYIPAWKILSDEVPMNTWSDKIMGNIVFIGTGAEGLKDIVATPVSGADPGVLVHAQVVEQILGDQFLKRPYWVGLIELCIIIGAGVFLSVVLPYVGAAKGAVLSALAAFCVGYYSWFSFKNDQLLIDPIYPLLSILSTFLVITIASFYLTEAERSRIRSAFSMYLSPTMVKKVSEDPGLLTLGGEERNMTILFLDIRSFSKISEGLEPSEITTFLNIFLTPMTNILQDNQATIDKYIGDAIVAFWNAPLDDDNHEKNAAIAVMEMMQSLDDLNERYEKDPDVKWPKDVRMGIGLNTGVCCVGNLGSEQRFSYSMIGDAANLAARIEGLTKQYKVHVLVGNSTAQELKEFAIIEADMLTVVGRKTPERIFVLAGTEKDAKSADFLALKPLHDTFLAAYREQDWDTAQPMIPELVSLAKSLDFHGYYDVMNTRIDAYREDPPAKDWGGIFAATSK